MEDDIILFAVKFEASVLGAFCDVQSLRLKPINIPGPAGTFRVTFTPCRLIYSHGERAKTTDVVDCPVGLLSAL